MKKVIEKARERGLDGMVTCTTCGKSKKFSEIKLPKGYSPTFVDGYYRCLACFEADSLYTELSKELARYKAGLEKACKEKLGHLCSNPWRMMRSCQKSTDINQADPCPMCWQNYFLGD